MKKIIWICVACVALLVALPARVEAADPVKLELGGDGATPWSINNIAPGDSGAKTVTLTNSGDKAGTLTVWLSDIVSGEGINPPSETGNTAQPGELDGYLLFNLVCSQLSTNITLPATIDKLPQSFADPNYIKISPINAGQTLTLIWNWELPLVTGNDVQGDTLSFTINYTLEEVPSTGSPGPGDYSDINFLEIDVLGKRNMVEISNDGIVRRQYLVTDFSRNVILEIRGGTKVALPDNGVPAKMVIAPTEELLPVSDGVKLIGPVYKAITYRGSMVATPAAFEPSIRLTLSYDPRLVPANASSIFVAEYSDIADYSDGENFVRLLAPIDYRAESGKVMAEVNSLRWFATAVEVETPPPAKSNAVTSANLSADGTTPPASQPVKPPEEASPPAEPESNPPRILPTTTTTVEPIKTWLIFFFGWIVTMLIVLVLFKRFRRKNTSLPTAPRE